MNLFISPTREKFVWQPIRGYAGADMALTIAMAEKASHGKFLSKALVPEPIIPFTKNN